VRIKPIKGICNFRLFGASEIMRVLTYNSL